MFAFARRNLGECSDLSAELLLSLTYFKSSSVQLKVVSAILMALFHFSITRVRFEPRISNHEFLSLNSKKDNSVLIKLFKACADEYFEARDILEFVPRIFLVCVRSAVPVRRH